MGNKSSKQKKNKMRNPSIPSIRDIPLTKDGPTKLLIAGTDASGKSTLFRQIQILSSGKIPTEDFKSKIHEQIIMQVRHILWFMEQELQIKLDTPEVKPHVESIYTGDSLQYPLAQYTTAIKYFWEKHSIFPLLFKFDHEKRNYYRSKLGLEIYPSTIYFLNHIDRISDSEYEPSLEDILRVKAGWSRRSQRARLKLNGKNCHIVRWVPDQARRAKPHPPIHDISIFMVSLADYHELVINDSTSIMGEAMEMFQQSMNDHRKYHTKSKVVLLLNMTDLFAEKIKKIPITACRKFNDFVEFAMKYRGVISTIFRYFCGPMNDQIPTEIKQVIAMFIGFELKLHEIDEQLLVNLRWKEDNRLKMESDKYDYELCRHYIKYKFEEIVRSPTESESDLIVYFCCALDADNVKSVLTDIVKSVSSV